MTGALSLALGCELIEPEFERVRDVLLAVGASACAVYLDGSVVVDLACDRLAPGSPLESSPHAAAVAAAMLLDLQLVDLGTARDFSDRPGDLMRRVTGRSLADFFRSEVADPLGLATLTPAPALARMYAAAVGPVDGKRLLRTPAPLRVLGFERATPIGPATVLGSATATEIAFAIPGARIGVAVIADGGDAQDAVVRAVLECLYSLEA